MYQVEISLWNLPICEIRCKEHVTFYSKWAARQMARKYAECIDVAHVEIVDCETGELILELDNDGKVIWDTEG